MTNLFQKGNFVLSSGVHSVFKIECDALTDEDMECIAYMISKKLKFRTVTGVKGKDGGDTGNGIRLERYLKQYCIENDSLPNLVCDDVYTTGKSLMIAARDIDNAVGVVIFYRSHKECPGWVHPLFTLNF